MLFSVRNFLENAGGITRHHGAGRNVLGHDTASTNDGVLAHGDATKQRGVRADRGASFHHRRNHGPIRLGLGDSTRAGGPRKPVVGEHHTVPEKYLVLDRDAFANEGMAGDLAGVANLRTFLNFNKGADARIVPDDTAVEIDESEKANVPAQLDVVFDQAERLVLMAHAAIILPAALGRRLDLPFEPDLPFWTG